MKMMMDLLSRHKRLERIGLDFSPELENIVLQYKIERRFVTGSDHVAQLWSKESEEAEDSYTSSSCHEVPDTFP